MLRLVDYIRHFQPDVLESLASFGFCVPDPCASRENPLTALYGEGEELNMEQRYLDKLMRQPPRPGRG